MILETKIRLVLINKSSFNKSSCIEVMREVGEVQEWLIWHPDKHREKACVRFVPGKHLH
jgi:hypothetical protein